MKFLKGLGGMFGYILGAVIVLPMLLLAYNYFFINQNNSGQFIPDYIKSSLRISISIPAAVPSDVEDGLKSPVKDDIYNFKTITTAFAAKNMGRDASRKSKITYRVFYDRKSDKYFEIMMFDLGFKNLTVWETGSFWYLIDGNTVNIQVNRADLENPKMGTEENPIPVFKVWGTDKPLQDLEGYKDPQTGKIKQGLYNFDITDEQYRYNVMMYLTYVMPKKEFEERFGKQPNTNGWWPF